jgi:hypothetical protein
VASCSRHVNVGQIRVCTLSLWSPLSRCEARLPRKGSGQMDWMLGFSQSCIFGFSGCTSFWTGFLVGAFCAGSIFAAFTLRQRHHARDRRHRGDLLGAHFAPARTGGTTGARWQDRASAGRPESHCDLSATIRARIRTVAETKRETSPANVVSLRAPPRNSL